VCDGWGFYGEDLDVACRLLDAPSVKRALKDAAASPLVLVISDEIRSAIIRHGYVDIGPQVQSVTVQIAQHRRRGWVHIPVPAAAERTLPAGRAKTSLRAIAPPTEPATA
jgi:hypothetical protein